MHTNAKLNTILANWIQEHIESIIHHDELRFFPETQEWFTIHKLMIYYISKLKNINHMIISIHTEKVLTKFNNHLWKNLSAKWI